MRGFGSDNHASVHPQIMQALLEANVNHAPSYGTDQWTEQAELAFKKHFGDKAKIFFVFNGTAANVLCLRAANRSHQSVICTDVAHINVDECAAPEVLAQTKLIAVPHHQGKLTKQQIEDCLIRLGDQHFAQVKMVSLTQPTELGTLYSLEELKDITAFCKSKKLYVHIDGARLANAAYKLGCTFKQMTTDLGVDLVSFGGTKNGLLGGEAVVFLNPELAQDFVYLRKQFGQLPSKTRFIAAQFIAYFANDLWLEIAKQSCDLAQLLHEKCKTLSGVEVTQPVQSNAVFAKIPAKWVKPLRQNHFFYVWDEKTFECRWMTSWDLTEADILSFTAELEQQAQRQP